MNILRTISLLLALVAVEGMAANGNNLIAVSPAANAMGGTGTAAWTNTADAVYRNPALLSQWAAGDKTASAEIWGGIFNNGASGNNDTVGAGAKASTSSPQMIPNMAASWRPHEQVTVGLGILAVSGAVVDQLGQVELSEMKTYNSIVRVAPTVAFKVNEMISIGASPYATWGKLALNENTSGGGQSTRAPSESGAFGAQFGVTVKPMEKMTIGMTYNTKTAYKYSAVVDLDRFGPLGTTALALDDLNVEQPAEASIGVEYRWTENFRTSVDYRNVGWSSAAMYSQIGWKDSNIIAVGAEYDMDEWSFRAGYNYGTAPVKGVTGEAGLNPITVQGHSVFAQSLSQMNMVAFPGISEHHITLGAAYRLGNSWDFAIASEWSPTTTVTRSGTGLAAYSFTASVSQWGVSTGARYLF